MNEGFLYLQYIFNPWHLWYWLIICLTLKISLFLLQYFDTENTHEIASYIWLVWFYAISTLAGYLMPSPLYPYILDICALVWLGLVLWHINSCSLFNAKSSLQIYIKYIWLGLVGSYGKSTICRLFNAKSSLYIYIKYIWFGLVGFYGISTIVGYLMPNPLYTYILNIWF